MGISPINVARVSDNLRAFNLLATSRASQIDLFRIQNQLATGLKFLAPSEDPTAASATSRLDRRLDVLKEVSSNLLSANTALRSVESAIQEGSDLLIQAQQVASEAAGDALSSGEREALGITIDSILEQLVTVGNRQHLGSFLFSGFNGAQAPFDATGAGVQYRGDSGGRNAIIDGDFSQGAFTIPGAELFNAESGTVQGFVDLNPNVTPQTRIADLRGATGTGVDLGHILVSDGNQQTEIDLNSADTVGDLIDLLNANMPSTLASSLNGNSIVIASATRDPVDVTVIDVANGNTAVELGIGTNGPQNSVFGIDLDPKLTERTALAQLNNGAGINLAGGLVLRNGAETAVIDFLGAQTTEDVLNRINASDIGVQARIADDGRTIEVVNRVSGRKLAIEENGGGAATALGVRSMHAGTPLSSLNDGLGIDSVAGDDIRVVTADGRNIDVDINSVDPSTGTLQDVIDLFNTAGGGAISASLAISGNGLVLTDNTAGPGALRVERLNVSPAMDSLGLDTPATGNQIVGRDVNPVIVDSPFTALVELRAGLTADDTQTISAAARRVERTLDRFQEVQGRVAATAQTTLERSDRVASETTATQVLRSDIADVDLTEAIVRFQQVQNALQANLSTASRVLNLSLLDFLR